jgi:flagellar hook-associated protein 2
MQLIENKTETEEKKKTELEKLDGKYDDMAAVFSAYGSVITKMESSFSGLKRMMAESIATK